MRTIFRVVARLFPRLAGFVKEAYYTLNGWRFDDVKTHITHETSHSGLSSLSLERTLRTALDDANSNVSRFAFVTCLPPEDTGIATCSLYSWLGSNAPVDIFCPVVDLDWFFTLSRRLANSDHSGPRLFDVGGFLTMNGNFKYSHIVLAVGNSNHHIYIFELLKKLSSVGSLARVTLYVHDPCLLNLVQRGAKLSEVALLHVMQELYGRPLKPSEPGTFHHSSLIEQGVFGVRYFFSNGIDKFLVNSKAAASILERDLAGTGALVRQIFHPVFLPDGVSFNIAAPKPANEIVIGSFGGPGIGKRTDLVVLAANELKRRGNSVRLLLAGYEIRKFTDHYDRLFKDLKYTIFDGPTDVQLVRCMQQCDVAVQLRAENLGESSGIVSQLLCLGKSVIVSNLGSFAEFEDAVSIVDPALSVDDLAERIMMLYRTPVDASAIRLYVDAKRPARFQERFLELFDLSPRVTEGRAALPSSLRSRSE